MGNATGDFTYYCAEHRDQVALAAGPSTRSDKTGGFANGPCCPICNEWMFWVPNGGTVIPEPEPRIRVRCRKNGATTGLFTDDRIYPASHVCNNLWQVADDRGGIRYIIPDEPCPHLVRGNGYGMQDCVGTFETIAGANA